jgi:hypothetical protein
VWRSGEELETFKQKSRIVEISMSGSGEGAGRSQGPALLTKSLGSCPNAKGVCTEFTVHESGAIRVQYLAQTSSYQLVDDQLKLQGQRREVPRAQFLRRALS